MQKLREISFLAIGLILITGVIAGAGVGGIVTSDERPPIGQAPPINDTTTAGGEQRVTSQSQSSVESPQTYAVTAHSADAIDTHQLTEYGEVGTQADERIEVTMSPTGVAAVKNLSWVKYVRPVIRPEPVQTETEADIPGSKDPEENGSLGVQQVHQNGITGEGVKVGIIDFGFDPTNQAIASNVVETRSLRNFPGDPAHGTSVAEVVTQVAPDSQLYLMSTRSVVDDEQAISYLTSQDVDIIIYSLGIPAFEDDGSHILADDILAAAESGTLFAAAAGNYAQTHWEGEFRDTDGNNIHEWTADGDELNCLNNCDEEYSGSLTVYVRWTDQRGESRYRPSLFNPVTDEYIAVGSERIFTTSTGTEYTVLSVAEVPSQPVDLVVEHLSGPANDDIEVVVSEGPQQIQRNVPSSSLTAPADVQSALTVAAYQVGPSRLAPYSGRGPTDDGRAGVDVTGYTNIGVTNELYGTDEFIFTGTSAAAPYAGGVAALIEESKPGNQSPTELTSTLTSSSDDILDSGTDDASGSGVVNAVDAVDFTETPPTSDPPVNLTTQRTLSATEVTNGSTVTVTVEATFNSTIENATLIDNVTGPRITKDDISIENSDSGFETVTSGPAVNITYNSALQAGTVNFGLGDDSLTVKYKVTVPADTPVGTTIMFDGNVTNTETSETTAIGGDTRVEVVTAANATPDTVTVGNQEVPIEFTSETASGERTVTADNAVDAINRFIDNSISADTAVTVINAFIDSS